MKKKILFLGAAAHQISPILYAKKKNYFVIVCDANKKSPGAKYASKFCNVSISDKKKILELSKNEKINAIISYASEVGSTTQAYVANKMKLPSNLLSSVETLAYKNKFRFFLKKEGFVFPKNRVFTDFKKFKFFLTKNNKLPFIIKPVDASGSKGISKINDLINLKKKFDYAKKFSKSKKIICEEFLERKGSQIAGDGFVYNGRLAFAHLADQYFNLYPNPLIPIGESWPSTHTKQNLKKALITLQKVFKKLKIKFGAFNFDLQFIENNKFMIIEIGPRNGGDYIPELIKLSTGVDLIRATVEASLGNRLFNKNFKKKYNRFFSTFRINSKKSGILKKIIISEKLKKNIFKKKIFYKKNQKVKKFNLGRDALGILILKFNSLDEMKYKMNSIDQNIKVILD